MDIGEVFANGIMEGVRYAIPGMLRAFAPYIVIILLMYVIAALIKQIRKQKRQKRH